MKFDQTAERGGVDRRTRDAVARLLLESGPQTAAALSDRLGVSPTAVRRHLDALLADGLVAPRLRRPLGQRGRGRPAKFFALTESGREAFPHAYDDLASAALRYLRSDGGGAAVTAFAEHRLAPLEERHSDRLRRVRSQSQRVSALADVLSEEGYAASAQSVHAGDQLCQHHCPVAHVAAEFPALCEAETRTLSRLLGTHVQRLATIAHGDGVCTTFVPRTIPAGRKHA
ncbi:MAG: helix-turn-helix transcriptional regulator [Mycobacteriales bacterium]